MEKHSTIEVRPMETFDRMWGRWRVTGDEEAFKEGWRRPRNSSL
jgi:hypothetical protein